MRLQRTSAEKHRSNLTQQSITIRAVVLHDVLSEDSLHYQATRLAVHCSCY